MKLFEWYVSNGPAFILLGVIIMAFGYITEYVLHTLEQSVTIGAFVVLIGMFWVVAGAGAFPFTFIYDWRKNNV